MSGIFGIADSRTGLAAGADAERVLRAMGKTVAHRDWHVVDDGYVVETYTDAQAGLGLGRVGIGIFNRERQPVCSEDQGVVVFLSGEFYHTAGLRRELQARGHTFRDDSDLELLLRLYQDKGDDFIHDLEGVFVLAIWDRHRRLLVVANDRFGLCPHFYAHYSGQGGGRLVFAPEVGGVLADPTFEKRPDLAGMAQFFRFQRLLGDRTLFQGLHLLPYASILRFNQADGTLQVSRYWDFDEIPAWPAQGTFEDAVAEAGRLLRRAVEARMQGAYRIGVYLSGGLDSRTLLGFASQVRNRETPRLGKAALEPSRGVVSLTYGVPGCRDALFAAKIARRLHSPHHFVPLADGRWMREAAERHLEVTGGMAVWTHGHAAPTFSLGRDLMDVNLTGFAGDQVLGGRALTYSPLMLAAPDEVAYMCQAFWYLNQVHSWPGLTEVEERSLYAPDVYALVSGRAWDSLQEELGRLSTLPGARRWDAFTTIHQGTRLSNLNVVYQRAFFEARYPFCDYGLVDFVYSVPVEYRLHDRLYLAVINREIPAVTWVPRNTDERLLVNRRLVRQAHGLWQAARRRVTRERRSIIHEDPEGWLRRDLRDWAEELLFDPRTAARGIFSPAFLRSIFERHMSGHELHTIGKIAPIMTFEMMLRRFCDQE